VALYAAREAGQILVSRLGQANETQVKGRRNLVTEADFLSEKKVMGILREEYPGHGILSEESGASDDDAEFLWVLDPLDGTNNYHFGIPYFCVNLALAYRGEVIVGLTYDPVRDEMFQAVKGGGAYLNGRKISVTGITSLKDVAVGVDLGYNAEASDGLLAMARKVWPHVHCLRLMGSSSLGLANVACGRLGLYFHKYLHPWDVAAGLLLIREAGGEVLHGRKKPAVMHDRELTASSSTLLDEYYRIMEA
jgi:fructose-1,6-bisphosphatase/inositol monophosphatase family enzyme